MFNLRKDVEKALKKYPTLYSVEEEGVFILKGSFIATESKSKVDVEIYEIVIRFSENYPFRFPIVIETSGKIPKEIDRHVKPDGSLCFSNPQDELSLSKHGLDLVWFLNEILNAHLCREFVREKTGKYPTGERSHGNEGIWEGYYDVFNTINKEKILEQLNLILYHRPIGRNAACYCNNGKKYKTCHEKLESQIINIGREVAIKIFEFLKKDYERIIG